MTWAERLLSLVGLVLLAGVAAACVYVRLQPDNSVSTAGSVPPSVVVTQIIFQLGGPVATVGLSSLAGVAFVRAAHWRPPSPAGE
jgi:hypothetical protein